MGAKAENAVRSEVAGCSFGSDGKNAPGAAKRQAAKATKIVTMNRSARRRIRRLLKDSFVLIEDGLLRKEQPRN